MRVFYFPVAETIKFLSLQREELVRGIDSDLERYCKLTDYVCDTSNKTGIHDAEESVEREVTYINIDSKEQTVASFIMEYDAIIENISNLSSKGSETVDSKSYFEW